MSRKRGENNHLLDCAIVTFEETCKMRRGEKDDVNNSRLSFDLIALFRFK